MLIGGFSQDGASQARVDRYDPRRQRWSRLPELPLGLNHAMVASARGRVFVVGGYSGPIGQGTAQRRAFVLERGSWRELPPMPEPRAAAGMAAIGGRLYVAGGVTHGGLAREMLVFNIARERWSRRPGPTPREHLGATARAGKLYLLGGRTAGLDSNVATVERFNPRSGRWRSLPPLPQARGGTAAAVLGGRIVSVGGEGPRGTFARVFSLRVGEKRWRRLPNLPTPRHGLGVATVRGTLYVIAGGPEPGLTVSGANEALRLRAQ